MALFSDIPQMINLGAVLGVIIGGIIVGRRLKMIGTFTLAVFFGSGLTYIVSILRVFQPLFNIFHFIPFVGIFLRDIPNILSIIVNQVGFDVIQGPFALWFGKAMWGIVFGINIDIAIKLLQNVQSNVSRTVVVILVSFMFLMTLMLMAYQLSGIGCAFAESLCQINQGIYPALIPIVLMASFLTNIVMFIYPIVIALKEDRPTKDNLLEIAFAVIAVGFMSFRIWIPIAAGLTGNQATIVNIW